MARLVIKNGYLKASTNPVQADVYLIAVPTPFKENHVPDLSYVESAVKNLIPTLRKGALVILESTSPVGTTHKVQEIIFKLGFYPRHIQIVDVQQVYTMLRTLSLQPPFITP